MHILLDNLSAQIITGGLLLMLITVQARGQRTLHEVMGFYALRKQQVSFIDFLKRDLQNVTDASSLDEDPTTLTFTFYGQTDPADTTAHQVAYKRRLLGTQDGVEVYDVQRFVDGVYAGGSMPTITDWQISARNAEGGAVAAPADARQIYVRFEVLNPFGSHVGMGRTRWEATFRPPGLHPDDNV